MTQNLSTAIPGSRASAIPFVDPPTTATSNGSKGDHAWDASYLYVCVADNTWTRVAMVKTW